MQKNDNKQTGWGSEVAFSKELVIASSLGAGQTAPCRLLLP